MISLCPDHTMHTLIIATNNQNKYREIAQDLSVLPCVIRPMPRHDHDDPEETGFSFVENALIKARAGCIATHQPCLADDSGLCVPALQGQPGIHTRRFAGPHATDQDNYQKLLSALEEVPDRRAFFCCALVVLRSPEDPCPIIAQGQWHGHITRQAQEINRGFGYEPIFQPLGETRTANQFSLEEKNRCSHRGQAMRQLIPALTHLLNSHR